MLFKLGMSAQQHCRKLRGFEWLTRVISGVKFREGIEVHSDRRTSLRLEGSGPAI